jgi:hypothetical protein
MMALRALLFQASLPSSFWPDALLTSSYLLNRRPCRPYGNSIPFALLFGTPLDYFLAAYVTQTLLPLLHTSLLPALSDAFF